MELRSNNPNRSLGGRQSHQVRLTIPQSNSDINDTHRKHVCSGDFNFTSIQGSRVSTLHDIYYNVAVASRTGLIKQKPVFHNVSGDGTVPLQEALTEQLSTKYLYMGLADHRHMIRDGALISDVLHILSGYDFFDVIKLANTQPEIEHLCSSPTPPEEPATEGPSSGQSSRFVTILLVSAAVFVVLLIGAAIIVYRIEGKKKQYEQI